MPLFYKIFFLLIVVECCLLSGVFLGKSSGAACRPYFGYARRSSSRTTGQDCSGSKFKLALLKAEPGVFEVLKSIGPVQSWIQSLFWTRPKRPQKNPGDALRGASLPTRFDGGAGTAISGTMFASVVSPHQLKAQPEHFKVRQIRSSLRRCKFECNPALCEEITRGFFLASRYIKKNQVPPLFSVAFPLLHGSFFVRFV